MAQGPPLIAMDSSSRFTRVSRSVSNHIAISISQHSSTCDDDASCVRLHIRGIHTIGTAHDFQTIEILARVVFKTIQLIHTRFATFSPRASVFSMTVEMARSHPRTMMHTKSNPSPCHLEPSSFSIHRSLNSSTI